MDGDTAHSYTATHYTSPNRDQNNEYLQDWETLLCVLQLVQFLRDMF